MGCLMFSILLAIFFAFLLAIFVLWPGIRCFVVDKLRKIIKMIPLSLTAECSVARG